MELLMFGLVLLQGISPCFGFPNGAPTSACDDMVPRHTGVQPQPTPAPYTILTSTRTLQTGQPITGKMLDILPTPYSFGHAQGTRCDF